MEKMSKDIELNHNDKITIYELSFTFFTVISQANNFVFSDKNVVL